MLRIFQPKKTNLPGEIFAILIFCVPIALGVGIVEGGSVTEIVIMLMMATLLSIFIGTVVHVRRKRGLPTI
jgi:nitrate/nitrite transporter NarK